MYLLGAEGYCYCASWREVTTGERIPTSITCRSARTWPITQVRRMRTANPPPAQRQLQAKERRNVGNSFSGCTAAAGGSLFGLADLSASTGKKGSPFVHMFKSFLSKQRIRSARVNICAREIWSLERRGCDSRNNSTASGAKPDRVKQICRF